MHLLYCTYCDWCIQYAVYEMHVWCILMLFSNKQRHVTCISSGGIIGSYFAIHNLSERRPIREIMDRSYVDEWSIHTCQHNWWEVVHTLDVLYCSYSQFISTLVYWQLPERKVRWWFILEKELCCSVLHSINVGSELELIYIMVACASYRNRTPLGVAYTKPIQSNE